MGFPYGEGCLRQTKHEVFMIANMMRVFFDGSCPLCVREVAIYRRAAPPDIIWHDLSLAALEIPEGSMTYQPDRDRLLKRFHIYSDDGQWFHGAPAFVRLWSRLAPLWRTLALIGRLPGGLWLMDAVYALFLRIRPLMQRWASHYFRPDWLPVAMIAAIRSDHAGETGAVWIYRSMQWFTRDPHLRAMLEAHQSQEQIHLDAMKRILPWRFRSRLLPIWMVAGIVTGSIPALIGRRWVMATIAAVERFVDAHYLEQIEVLRAEAARSAVEAIHHSECVSKNQCGLQAAEALPVFGDYPDLLAMLEAFRQDELDHRDEALEELGNDEPSTILRMWCQLVGQGSALAVRLAKVI